MRTSRLEAESMTLMEGQSSGKAGMALEQRLVAYILSPKHEAERDDLGKCGLLKLHSLPPVT